MYLEERLEYLSQSDISRKQRIRRWEVIKQDASARLNTVCTHFPHFSKHDASHSQTIGIQVERLLGKERIDKLSASDILMLLASFYLHDIGMALEYEDIYQKFTSKPFQQNLQELATKPESDLYEAAKRLCNFSSIGNSYEHSIEVYNDIIEIIETEYRSQHAERSSEYIRNQTDIKQCFGIRCQSILASTCELHQKSIKEIMSLPQRNNGLFDDYIHPRFVAAMLCLGDLLDLDTDRFDEMSLRAAPPMPYLSNLHLRKHESIKSFLINAEGIHVKSDTEDIAVYKAMRQWLDWIQDACDYISLHWSEIAPSDFGNAPRLIAREILLNGTRIKAELANLQYKVTGKRMFKLLEGGGIYRNKLVCIREIVQNAIDATIFRLFDEKILSGEPDKILEDAKKIDWDEYKIRGNIVKKDNTHVKISLRDRGIGISEEDIYKIANVSDRRSEHQKKLIKEMPAWMRPSGNFGIGLHSIFLLTDEFVMITKTINESPKKITFQSSARDKGYIIVEEYRERFTQGTKIVFEVDLEKLTAEELGCPNYYYRRKLLSSSFLKRVMLDYSNQLRSIPPIREAKKKTLSVVPLDISVTDYRTGNVVSLLRTKPFYKSKIDNIDINSGNVQTNFFFQDLECYLSCYINLYDYSNQGHTYGTIESRYKRFYNTIFYRNEYIVDDCLESNILENLPLLPYVDWRIDLLGGGSGEILNLSRNTVRDEFAQKFLELLLEALERSIKKVIDYILKPSNNEKLQENIGDTILLLYQFAHQYRYHEKEIFDQYKHLMGNIVIANYEQWPDKKKDELTSIELMELEHIYFVSGMIPGDALPKYIKKKTKVHSDNRPLYRLEGGNGIHILNHRIERAFITKSKGQFVEVVEAVPFEFINPMKKAMELDDIVLRRQVIRMVKMSVRGLPVIRGYEDLATPINSEVFSVRHSYHAKAYLIELPLADFLEEIYVELNMNFYVEKAYDNYFEKIIESEDYKANLQYIKSYHDDDTKILEEKYKEVIGKVLRIIEDARYKKLNKFFMAQIIDPRLSTAVFNGRDILECNHYLATTIRG